MQCCSFFFVIVYVTNPMMTMYHIKAPKSLKASLLLPSSKSICNRALILNALCEQPKPIYNLSVCDDTTVVINALSQNRDVIDVGAAGTAMRFLTAYFAGQPAGRLVITGTERMKNRPVRLLVDALRSAGAHIEYMEKEGFPPLCIHGKTLKGGEIALDGGISSQYISALLMVAPMMTDGLRLHLTGHITSLPYIHMTVRLMRYYGVNVFQEGQTFIVPPQQYASVDHFTVESDWSAASYWFEAVALSADREASVTLHGLQSDSIQGDASIVALFDNLGVQTTFTPGGLLLTKKQRTNDGLLSFDFTAMPDMAQTVTVTCVLLGIPFRFTGLHTLKIKETDRLLALKTEVQKFGCQIDIGADHSLEWSGERGEYEPSPVIETYEDHRMAMAFAPVSLCLPQGIRIAHPEVVSKSYPSFWDDLKKARFKIK